MDTNAGELPVLTNGPGTYTLIIGNSSSGRYTFARTYLDKIVNNGYEFTDLTTDSCDRERRRQQEHRAMTYRHFPHNYYQLCLSDKDVAPVVRKSVRFIVFMTEQALCEYITRTINYADDTMRVLNFYKALTRLRTPGNFAVWDNAANRFINLPEGLSPIELPAV